MRLLFSPTSVSSHNLAVAMELPSLKLLRPPLLVRVGTRVPYAPGYLGFRCVFPVWLSSIHPYFRHLNAFPREVPSYMQLIKQLQLDGLRIDAVAVDGFGSLHPRGAGAATQLGIEARLPFIGVGKSLSGVCTLREREVVASMDRSDCLQLDISSFCEADVGAASVNCKISCVAVRKDVTSRRPVYVTVRPKASYPKPLNCHYLKCPFLRSDTCAVLTQLSQSSTAALSFRSLSRFAWLTSPVGLRCVSNLIKRKPLQRQPF